VLGHWPTVVEHAQSAATEWLGHDRCAATEIPSRPLCVGTGDTIDAFPDRRAVRPADAVLMSFSVAALPHLWPTRANRAQRQPASLVESWRRP
jgi:hypothetical protein